MLLFVRTKCPLNCIREDSVDAQWIVAKKDYHKAMKQKKEFERMEKERERGRAQKREEPRNQSEDSIDDGDESVYRARDGSNALHPIFPWR